MSRRCELFLTRRVHGDTARPLRHALASFMKAVEVDEMAIDDIVTAVGEALANAIEHAYGDGRDGAIELCAHVDEGGSVAIEVRDQGSFIERGERQGRGFGLRIVRQIARSVSIDTTRGTTVRMIFDAPAAQSASS